GVGRAAAVAVMGGDADVVVLRVELGVVDVERAGVDAVVTGVEAAVVVADVARGELVDERHAGALRVGDVVVGEHDRQRRVAGVGDDDLVVERVGGVGVVGIGGRADLMPVAGVVGADLLVDCDRRAQDRRRDGVVVGGGLAQLVGPDHVDGVVVGVAG